MKKQMYSYRVHIRGVFGRNRTIKSNGYTLGKFDDRQPDDKVIELAKEKVAAIGLKSGGVANVTEQPIEVEDTGDGFVSESLMVFTDRKIDGWVVP